MKVEEKVWSWLVDSIAPFFLWDKDGGITLCGFPVGYWLLGLGLLLILVGACLSSDDRKEENGEEESGE